MPLGHSITFQADQFHIQASDEPFLRFSNGVRFHFQPDGNLVVYWGDGGVGWAVDQVASVGAGDVVRFQDDGNLVTYGHGVGPIWASNRAGNPAARLVLSREKPFVEIFRQEGARVFNSWDR